ncbi:MAG: transglycosylase SLT domain-containing protein [Bacteriovoracaceae bacterium]|nr:transglycosylase SLT domain-containing protein [Bacteriovoracaceae bacterium]
MSLSIILFSLLTLSFVSSPVFAEDKKSSDDFQRSIKKNIDALTTLNQQDLSMLPCQSNTEEEIKLPGLDDDFFKNGANCASFISESGEYGSWGKVIVDYIRKSPDKQLFIGKELKGMGPPHEICPNWPNLTEDEREHFWVWTIASIAWKESTCNPKSRNGSATNGVAVGLLQLDEKPKARSWRGKHCSVKTVSDPQNNIKCGLDILQEILKADEGDYRSNGLLYGKKNNSYWEQLRRQNGGKIGDLIRTHPLCARN